MAKTGKNGVYGIGEFAIADPAEMVVIRQLSRSSSRLLSRVL